MNGVRRRAGVITQPVEDGETFIQQSSLNARLTMPVKEESDINIRKIFLNEPAGVGKVCVEEHSYMASTSSSSDVSGMVVDMQQIGFSGNTVKVRHPGLSDQDFSINIRVDSSTCRETDDYLDLQLPEEFEEPLEKLKGLVAYGEDADISELLRETSSERGVIISEQKVLVPRDSSYIEGVHYKVFPDTESQGAYGKAAMCQDVTTNKVFVRKKVTGKVSQNEIEVPLKFRGNVGIPEVFGVIKNQEDTEIYQEFAGLSLKKLMETPYAAKLCDPKLVLVLAFQGYATLDKLHCQNVIHQDIKPENLCLDNLQRALRLKLIDFGSSKTPKDPVTFEGLTNEYLSPESCRAYLEAVSCKLPREGGRLGPGADVWAMALSLLYLLYGYHVMVYLCTGQTMYTERDPQKLWKLRCHSLEQISHLTDDIIQKKLIRPEWPEALKVLLRNTLRVDPKDRWSAKQCAHFLYDCILQRTEAAQQQQQQQQQSSPAPASVLAQSCSFSGLTPARLVIRSQPNTKQVSQLGREVQPMQVTSPASPASPPVFCLDVAAPAGPSASLPLPAFTALLSDELSKKAPHPIQYKQRKGPYPQPARKGSKVLPK